MGDRGLEEDKKAALKNKGLVQVMQLWNVAVKECVIDMHIQMLWMRCM